MHKSSSLLIGVCACKQTDQRATTTSILKPVHIPGLLLHSEGSPQSPWLPTTKKDSTLLQAHPYANIPKLVDHKFIKSSSPIS